MPYNEQQLEELRRRLSRASGGPGTLDELLEDYEASLSYTPEEIAATFGDKPAGDKPA